MFRKILSYLTKYKTLLILSIILAVINVVTSLITPYLFGMTIDLIIDKDNVLFNQIITNSIIISILIIVGALSQFFVTLFNNKVAYSFIKELRNEAFEKIEKLPLSYLDQNPKGEIISKIITDCEQLENGILMALSQFFTGVLTILGVIIIMITINIWVALFVILLTPLSLFAAKWISTNAYESFKLQSEKRANQTSIIDELIGNQKVVCAYSYEGKSMERFNQSNEELSKISLKATFISSLVNPTTRFINALIYATVALVGALLSIKNENSITIGMLVCLLGYANQYTKPFNEITGVIAELQNAYACADRIFELIDQEVESEVFEETISNTDKVTIDNISFSYDKNNELIKDFSIRVNKGDRIAIVGPTGCGKTTFINLLMRFYDVDGGDIKIGDTSIYKTSRKELREHFGMVLQDTWLRNATILENLTMGSEIPMEEIIQVCKNVKIYHFIKQLPKGFDTIIKNDDSLLSKGQRQLLCIARVMLTKPEFLILDEATSNIDTRTEILVQEAFKEVMKEKTSFIVAHRLSTIKECNTIIVMNNGQIIEFGTHEKLLENKGLYYELYNAQYSN